MRGVKVIVVAVLLWAMPLVATGQEKAGPETEAQKLTVKVIPSEKGCSVALSSKVGKALGTPEGLGNPTLGESGKEPLPSLIMCMCGPSQRAKSAPKAGLARVVPPASAPLCCVTDGLLLQPLFRGKHSTEAALALREAPRFASSGEGGREGWKAQAKAPEYERLEKFPCLDS